MNLNINVRSNENNMLRDKIKDVERCIVKECDDSRALRIDLDGVHKEIDVVSAEIAVADNINKNLTRRTADLEDKKMKIRSAEAEIDRLNDNIDKAKCDQNGLRCRLNDEVDRHHRMQKENDALVCKGGDLS